MKQFDNQNPKFATLKSSSSETLSIPCLFGEVRGKRLVVQTESTVPACQAVTIEYNDAMFLGEVIACVKDGGVFSTEIKVEQVLSGLQSLMALRSQLLGEAPARTPRVPSVASQLQTAVA